jgi:hypothetical protein
MLVGRRVNLFCTTSDLLPEELGKCISAMMIFLCCDLHQKLLASYWRKTCLGVKALLSSSINPCD